jgi:hypothetical protein
MVVAAAERLPLAHLLELHRFLAVLVGQVVRVLHQQ